MSWLFASSKHHPHCIDYEGKIDLGEKVLKYLRQFSVAKWEISNTWMDTEVLPDSQNILFLWNVTQNKFTSQTHKQFP